MMTIGRIPRITAALAALSANVALAGGLVSLAQHYDAQAAQPTVLATASAQCRPERAAPG